MTPNDLTSLLKSHGNMEHNAGKHHYSYHLSMTFTFCSQSKKTLIDKAYLYHFYGENSSLSCCQLV